MTMVFEFRVRDRMKRRQKGHRRLRGNCIVGIQSSDSFKVLSSRTPDLKRFLGPRLLEFLGKP